MENELSLVELCNRDAYELVLKRLKEGANPNNAETGMSPLMTAILRQNLRLMKLLVTYGADINYIDHVINLPPPCYYAIVINDALSLFWLLKAGAKTDYTYVPPLLMPHRSLDSFARHCNFFDAIKGKYDPTHLSFRDRVGILATLEFPDAVAATFDTVFETNLDATQVQECPHTMKRFFARGLHFEVKVLPRTHRCNGPTCHEVLEPHELFQTPTSLFIGFTDNEVIPKDGNVLINYRVDLYCPKTDEWLIGKEISGTLTEFALDRGLRDFAAGNGWPESQYSFYASTIRVSFKVITKSF